MYLRCADASVQLVEVDDLQRLHVEVEGHVVIGGALGSFGALEGDHAWLSIAALRAAAHAQGAAAGWDADFDAMVEYASSKGWLSPDGTDVRAHVVRTG